MDVKDIINIGEKLEIIVKRNSQEDIKGYSMLQDITSAGELVITQPMRDGVPIVIRPSDSIRVLFFKEEGCFAFDGRPINRFKIKNVDMISIRQISSIEKIQRRQFYRLKIVLPVEIKILDNKEGSPILKGYSVDISGNGLRLNIDQKLDVNSIIKCNIKLSSNETLSVKGRVVRVALDNKLAYKYDIGIAFVDIPNATQDRIVKFIFEKQRELISKGFV